MKIIKVSTFFYPEIGGVEKQCEEISNLLIKKNIQVEIFTTDASHTKNRLSKKEIQKRDKNNIYTFKYIFSLKKFFKFAPLLLFKLLFSKFDIIHIHNLHDAHLIGCLLIKIIKNKKIVITGHNPFSADKNFKSKSYKIYHFIIKIFKKYIDKYIAITQEEVEYVKKTINLNNNQIEHIPNGIKQIFFEYKQIYTESKKISYFNSFNINIKNYKKYIGWYGRLTQIKGLHLLKESIKNNIDTLFFFHGPINEKEYFENLENELKGFTNVFFSKKSIDTQEIIEFLNYIDYFVLPSINESFGLTLIEALSQGTEIIYSDQISLNKFLLQNKIGISVKENNPVQWNKIINNLPNKKSKNKKYIEFAQKYEWKNIIQKLINVYQEVLK